MLIAAMCLVAASAALSLLLESQGVKEPVHYWTLGIMSGVLASILAFT